jgi:hypothetical protein
MSRPDEPAVVTAQRWLLLSFQLPAKPAYLRVKTWRRLQGLGAVAIKNAVYALPMSEQTQEDFEWLLKEITEGGGEGLICEARLVGGLSDEEVRHLFRAARDADYDEVAKEVRALIGNPGGAASSDPRQDLAVQAKRARVRRDAIIAIDFFGANGRETVDGLLSELDRLLMQEHGARSAMEDASRRSPGDLRERTWVTRQGVHVDRIASAWLIRRFIDPAASFKFVPAKGYVPGPGELRFDMFEAEFTHEGDRCTFEVLLRHTGLDDPALRPVSEIVHDIDLKDGKFGREEAAGVRVLIAGICASTASDDERLSRGAAVFEDLYSSFRKTRS